MASLFSKVNKTSGMILPFGLGFCIKNVSLIPALSDDMKFNK